MHRPQETGYNAALQHTAWLQRGVNRQTRPKAKSSKKKRITDLRGPRWLFTPFLGAPGERLYGQLVARRRRTAAARPFDAHRRHGEHGVVARRLATFDDAWHLRCRVGIDSAAGEAHARDAAAHR